MRKIQKKFTTIIQTPNFYVEVDNDELKLPKTVVGATAKPTKTGIVS